MPISPSDASDPLLRLSGTSKVYQLGAVTVRAVDDVDLSFERGKLVVLLGPSGSGKTTILNLLGGLDRPTKGSVSYDGRDITGLSSGALSDYRRRHIGFVFQFFNLIPTLTARENIEFAAELVLGDRAQVRRRADELLRVVGLGERGDQFPGQLSGGEQQRVAIARALSKDPDVLLCDEPTGNLDFRTGRLILEYLQKTTFEQGKLCIIVTHNSAFAGIADRVIRIRDGKVQRDDTNETPRPASEIEW